MRFLAFITVLLVSMTLTDGQNTLWRIPSRLPSRLPIRRRINPFVNPFPVQVLPRQNIVTRRTRPFVSPPVRTVYKPPPAVRAVIDSLTSAIDSKEKDVAYIINEIIRVLEVYRTNTVSRITRAVVDTFITGKPLEVGFKQSLSTAKADVITKALKILNALPGEQIVTLKSALSKKFGLNYKTEVLTEPAPPPKYEIPPEVKNAHENLLLALRSNNTETAKSEAILSDIIKFATSAEIDSVVPSHLSSSAKIIVDAFVSNRKLKPGHPSASILEALRSLPDDQAKILMDQFLKVIAMNPQSDPGIIHGISNMVLEEKNLTEIMIRKQQIAEAEKMAAEQAQKSNQNRILQLELEQKRKADEARAEQLRRVDEQNKRFAEETSRTIRMMELENQRRMAAENERLRRLESRNINQFEAFRKHAEMTNSLPVDAERELWRMNAHLLQKHGPEARKWLENVKNNVATDTVTIDSQTPQSGANGTADYNILDGKNFVQVADQTSKLGGNGTEILSPISNNVDILPPSNENIVIPSGDNNGIVSSAKIDRNDILSSSGDNTQFPIVPSTTLNISPRTILRQRRPVFNTIQRVPPSRRLIRIRRPLSLRFQNRLPTRNFDSRFRPIYFQ